MRFKSETAAPRGQNGIRTMSLFRVVEYCFKKLFILGLLVILCDLYPKAELYRLRYR